MLIAQRLTLVSEADVPVVSKPNVQVNVKEPSTNANIPSRNAEVSPTKPNIAVTPTKQVLHSKQKSCTVTRSERMSVPPSSYTNE